VLLAAAVGVIEESFPKVIANERCQDKCQDTGYAAELEYQKQELLSLQLLVIRTEKYPSTCRQRCDHRPR
jgi:hypothetical protein